MLKVIAITALSVVGALSAQPNQASTNEQKPAEHSNPSVSSTNAPDKQQNCKAADTNPGSNPPASHEPIEDPNWWLVGAALLTCGVIAWQSWETRQAAIGTKKAADASVEQIMTMKGRERARLAISEVFTPVLALKSKTDFAEIPLKVTMIVINDGNSHAFNVRACGQFNIEESVDEPGFSFSNESLNWHRLAFPNTIRSIGNVSQTELYVTQAEDRKHSSCIAGPIAAGLIRQEFVLTIGGEITYEDIWGDEHSTPFFMVWANSGDRDVGTWGSNARWINLSGKST